LHVDATNGRDHLQVTVMLELEKIEQHLNAHGKLGDTVGSAAETCIDNKGCDGPPADERNAKGGDPDHQETADIDGDGTFAPTEPSAEEIEAAAQLAKLRVALVTTATAISDEIAKTEAALDAMKLKRQLKDAVSVLVPRPNIERLSAVHSNNQSSNALSACMH
jgi:hypothetical protein